MPLIFGPELIRFCEQILIAASVPADTASLVATSLVAANLRAVDSHGVQLLPYYVEHLEGGDMVARAGAGFRRAAPASSMTARTGSASRSPILVVITRSASPGRRAWGWWWRVNRITLELLPFGRRRCPPPGRSVS